MLIIEGIVVKIAVFLISLASLFLLKEGFMFYKALLRKEPNITNKRLWGIGVSIAFLLTMIITGILI